MISSLFLQTCESLFSFQAISWLTRIRKDGFEHDLYAFSMAAIENSSTLEKTTDAQKQSNNTGRAASAEFNNIQDGGHVVSSNPTSSLQQNSLGVHVPTITVAQVGE